MPASKRSIRFADAENHQPPRQVDAGLLKKFKGPVEVSDPAALRPVTRAAPPEIERKQSVSHLALVNKLRERNTAIHKSVLMSLGKASIEPPGPQLPQFQTKGTSASKESADGPVPKASTAGLEARAVGAEACPPKKTVVDRTTPRVEWWDEKWYYELTDANTVGDAFCKKDTPKCVYKTAYERPQEGESTVNLPAIGAAIKTPKELRSQRKKLRQEKARKQRETIHRGEAAPHPAKLTMENIQNILKNRKMPAMDPIECEAIVVADQVNRRQSHEERNQKAKKTAEERSLKRHAQLQREAKESPRVLFFEIQSRGGSHQIHRNPAYLRVILNIQQLYITGVFWAVGERHFILLECGRKPAEKIKALLTRRMVKAVQCSLLHESEINERQFSSFDAKEFSDIPTARTYFEDMQYPFLMDIC
ncbi:hypothetical protein XU18_1873 [Perkinsela sp. CCAP 1560/4]|nr:hypothetical protein XU18_1873 [Perkinsela sp. CCAP 1560/4]|eukprot:KNH07341.1 hypothetical protein XU18_1873 [Perkinsela sp. CCAP 1560/4]